MKDCIRRRNIEKPTDDEYIHQDMIDQEKALFLRTETMTLTSKSGAVDSTAIETVY